MSQELYHSKFIDFTKEPMFLGEGKNTQRFDVMKYPFFDERNDKMQGADWVATEINMSSDYVDFNTSMLEAEQFIYKRTLQKLIFLDSLQGRGILLTLGQIVTLPELENAMLTWEYFEGAKHSKAYSHNLKSVFPNPTEVFDESFDIPELTKLTDSISKPYQDCYELIIKFQYYLIMNEEITPEFMKQLKQSVIRLLVNINILEGVRFYPGFAAIWAMNKGQGYVEGSSKELKLICRDENYHLSITQKILQLMKRDASEGFKDLYAEMEEEISDMYTTAYEEEVEWIQYIFSKGSTMGLNAEILIEYLKHIIDKRRKAIGLPVHFHVSKNPLPWIQSYINMDQNEVLPQEGEIVNYVTGGVDKSKGLDYKELGELLK